MLELLTTTVYGWVALFSTLFVLVKLILGVFGFIDDLDLDADGVVDFDGSSLVSPKGILHFLCGYSWYLVLIQFTVGEIRWFDWLIGLAIGIIIVVLMGLLYYGLSKLNSEVTPEKEEDLVGKTIEIYSSIGENRYTILIEVNGYLSEKVAISKSSKTYAPGEKTSISEFSDGKLWIE